MNTFPVAEIFESINGEGPKAGQLALFVRIYGCNLNCSYCDTAWAKKVPAKEKTRFLSAGEIADIAHKSGISNITLTGGEPLLDPNVSELLAALAEVQNAAVEVETNGSIDLAPFIGIADGISYTMDYKLPGSGEEEKMCTGNFGLLREKDAVKFVVGSREDLNRAYEMILRYQLTGRTKVYLSPVFGKIAPEEIVDFMKEKQLNNVCLMIQMHKVIWDPDARGV